MAVIIDDPYTECEAALMTKIRTLTDIFPRDFQVSDDDSVLNRGADNFAIFQPDAFPYTRANGRQAHYNWVVIFDLYVRYKSRKESLPKFKEVRAALIKLLHPLALNGARTRDNSHGLGIEQIAMSAGGGLQQDIPGDNPNFIIQTMSVTIIQLVTYNI
jgi:hypothetical protein